MALKDDEFENVVLTLSKNNYILERIKSNENFLSNITDIRQLHAKYEKEAEIYRLNPHYEEYIKNGLKGFKGLNWIRAVCLDIKKLCNENGIDVIFFKKETLEFKKGLIAHYKISGNDINGLIYYHKEKAEKQKEEINNLEIE